MGALTISIITQNNRDYIDRCLKSIYSSFSHVAFEVVVIDNASQDGSAALIRDKYPQVHLITNPHQRGFSENHNDVLRSAGTEYIALFNDDTIIKPNVIDTLVNYLETHPDVGVVGCRLIYPDHCFQPSFGSIPTPLSELFSIFTTSRFYHKLISPWALRRFRSPVEVGWLTGAALFIRRKAGEAVSFLDDDFVAYYEDVDLCYRISQKGWKIVYNPTVEIVHYRGATRSQDVNRNIRLIYQSREIFFMKHFGKQTLQWLRIITVLELPVRIILIWTTLLFRPKSRKQNLEMLKAYTGILFRMKG